MRTRRWHGHWVLIVLIAPFCLGASCRSDIQDAAESGALDFVSATAAALLETALLSDGPLAD